MYSFIVLGYVPGTNLQITFQAWIIIAGLAGIFFGLAKLRELHRELADGGIILRMPLHASQLHRRA